MGNNESDAAKVAGCGLLVYSAFVTTPMWLILLFAIMSREEMPLWAWGLYWCYVPALIIGVIAASIVRTVIND